MRLRTNLALSGVLSGLLGISGCACHLRRGPEPIAVPLVPIESSLDVSQLRFEVGEAYLLLQQGPGRGYTRYIVIHVTPLPAEFWQAGGTIAAELDGMVETEVMFMEEDYAVIYLYAPDKREHEVALWLVDPRGREFDRRRVRVERETWKSRRYAP